MGHKQQLNRLAKFLAYVLGHRPDEFGLIPDREGFIKIKHLLQALSEEAGWRHVRRANLREVTLSLPNSPLEIVDQEIRARDRSRLLVPPADTPPPKLLYTCVRQKAYPHVIDKGLTGHGNAIVLCSRKRMAARLGRRRDHQAVQLTVQVAQAVSMGVSLVPCGEGLFQADHLPPGCFSGPPLPKAPPPKQKTKSETPVPEQTPGSFYLDLEIPEPDKKKGKSKRKDQAWKRERRRHQRNRNADGKWP